MKESVRLKEFFKVEPSVIYHAWLNGKEHSKMTGGEAVSTDKVGEEFTAWDGYISGRNVELVENEKIVQSWRSSEFDDSDEDSELTILLSERKDGTELTLIHTNIPEGQTQYEQGWIDNYFVPMKEYFSRIE